MNVEKLYTDTTTPEDRKNLILSGQLPMETKDDFHNVLSYLDKRETKGLHIHIWKAFVNQIVIPAGYRDRKVPSDWMHVFSSCDMFNNIRLSYDYSYFDRSTPQHYAASVKPIRFTNEFLWSQVTEHQKNSVRWYNTIGMILGLKVQPISYTKHFEERTIELHNMCLTHLVQGLYAVVKSEDIAYDWRHATDAERYERIALLMQDGEANMQVPYSLTIAGTEYMVSVNNTDKGRVFL